MDEDYPKHLLAREPAPPWNGKGPFALWHFSEDPSLGLFRPRARAGRPGNGRWLGSAHARLPPLRLPPTNRRPSARVTSPPGTDLRRPPAAPPANRRHPDAMTDTPVRRSSREPGRGRGAGKFLQTFRRSVRRNLSQPRAPAAQWVLTLLLTSRLRLGKPSSSGDIALTIRSRSSMVANSTVILPFFAPISTLTRVSNRSESRSDR